MSAQRLSMPEPAWLLQLFGMRALCISGFEADDLIGTLVNRATSEGMAVVLISPDKVSLLADTPSGVVHAYLPSDTLLTKA